jgi:hypothetical protein
MSLLLSISIVAYSIQLFEEDDPLVPNRFPASKEGREPLLNFVNTQLYSQLDWSHKGRGPGHMISYTHILEPSRTVLTSLSRSLTQLAK